jgi:hypothetical protein
MMMLVLCSLVKFTAWNRMDVSNPSLGNRWLVSGDRQMCISSSEWPSVCVLISTYKSY